MKRALMLVGLAAAIACGSSAGDMMSEAFDDMTDVPDAGAQPTECVCEAGPQGERGEQGEPGSAGEPGHNSVFCADFGAFCGFSAETFASMTDCRDAIAQLDDDGVVCTARTLQAARSGDTGGCGAIANLDPCGFTPAPPSPEIKVHHVSVRSLSSPGLSRLNSSNNTTYCNFDTGAPVLGVPDGANILVDAVLTESVYELNDYDHYFAYRLVGDTGNGTLIHVQGRNKNEDTLVTVIESLAAGNYELGSCAEIYSDPQYYGNYHYYSGLEDMKIFVLNQN